MHLGKGCAVDDQRWIYKAILFTKSDLSKVRIAFRGAFAVDLNNAMQSKIARNASFVAFLVESSVASKKVLSFAEGREPWLNDLYPCRMHTFNNLHVVVGSNVNKWEATKQDVELMLLIEVSSRY